jgi:hypothetical protein
MKNTCLSKAGVFLSKEYPQQYSNYDLQSEDRGKTNGKFFVESFVSKQLHATDGPDTAA